MKLPAPVLSWSIRVESASVEVGGSDPVLVGVLGDLASGDRGSFFAVVLEVF